MIQRQLPLASLLSCSGRSGHWLPAANMRTGMVTAPCDSLRRSMPAREWPTDAALRETMGKLRTTMAAALPTSTRSDWHLEGYAALAKNVRAGSRQHRRQLQA